jgi:hypothetical protein
MAAKEVAQDLHHALQLIVSGRRPQGKTAPDSKSKAAGA